AAKAVANLPPTGALFAAFLGYNPLGTLLSPNVLQHLSAATRATVLGKQFFPTLLSGPFGSGLTIAFIVSAICCVGAAVLSLLRGKPVIHEEMTSSVPQSVGGVGAEPLAVHAHGGD
ncbi:MAG TPA: hypothetical protein VFL82_00470, partial [Thermomicrobiales bacterium]|nr:hypothetical protein [Thermomicrobiales bacterium]